MRTEAYHARRRFHSGLCAGCANGVSCTFQDRLRRPVVECLNYQSDELTRGGGQGRENGRFGWSRSVPAASGLCVVCRQQSGCTQNGPDDGVWFCSEFG